MGVKLYVFSVQHFLSNIGHQQFFHQNSHGNWISHAWKGTFYLVFPKNRGKTPQKPYEQMDDLGGKNNPYFFKTSHVFGSAFPRRIPFFGGRARNVQFAHENIYE